MFTKTENTELYLLLTMSMKAMTTSSNRSKNYCEPFPGTVRSYGIILKLIGFQKAVPAF